MTGKLHEDGKAVSAQSLQAPSPLSVGLAKVTLVADFSLALSPTSEPVHRFF